MAVPFPEAQENSVTLQPLGFLTTSGRRGRKNVLTKSVKCCQDYKQVRWTYFYK